MVTSASAHESYGARAKRVPRSLREEGEGKTFRINPLVVVGAMAGLAAADMISTQLFFNFAHTDAAHAEAGAFGFEAMHGGNNVFTSDAIKLQAGRVAYGALPYLALKGISYANRDNPDSWFHYGPNVIANMFATGIIAPAIYTDVTNSWDVLHAAGALPTMAPWQDSVGSAMQYWIGDAHILDTPLQGLMNYWDFADSTGLGFGNFTLLTAGTTALAGAGALYARKKFKQAHQEA